MPCDADGIHATNDRLVHVGSDADYFVTSVVKAAGCSLFSCPGTHTISKGRDIVRTRSVLEYLHISRKLGSREN